MSDKVSFDLDLNMHICDRHNGIKGTRIKLSIYLRSGKEEIKGKKLKFVAFSHYIRKVYLMITYY